MENQNLLNKKKTFDIFDGALACLVFVILEFVFSLAISYIPRSGAINTVLTVILELLFVAASFSVVLFRNKDIYIYSVNNDDMKNQTIETLNSLKNANYQNVTVISNNPEIYNSYNNYFLVINPGSAMGTGHNSNNVTNSNFFMFGNE